MYVEVLGLAKDRITSEEALNSRKNHTPASMLALIFVTVAGLGFCSRIAFLILAGEKLSWLGQMSSMFKGITFDAAVTLYIYLPFAVLAFLPALLWQKRWFQNVLYGLYFIEITIVAFGSLAEVFFIEEFHSRFNFIAVDYLVYTNEVIKNLWESFPMSWILSLHAIVVIAFTQILFRKLRLLENLKAHKFVALVALAVTGLCFQHLNEGDFLQNMSAPEAELSKNPAHTIFAAYRNNEIEFTRFYSTLGNDRAAHAVHEAFEEDVLGFSDNEGEHEDETSIVRNLVRRGPEKRLNVVIVLMESMSARFMKSFGSKNNITPTLDSLANHGLFFDRVYSTGTRTVRGIEAVVLSVPPTPGQSIVRRPDAGHIFNIGTVFRERGYSTQFLYGGRSFFDNMGNFFSSNGFEVLDQSTIASEDIQFSNAWGVCDEDLFNLAIRNADKMSPKPFLQFILTTSNHRPYTYPSGKIDIPSGSGRDGAVKYSDSAIRNYLMEAVKKPWFKDTVFVFVADHNASVAGGVRILPADYRIPVIFYAPDHISPKRLSILGSQIDVAPTLFGLLNFSYQSRFFGHDLVDAKTERAFLATYQKVGLWQNGKLILLSPTRKIEVFSVDGENLTAQSSFIANSGETKFDKDVESTIGYFETASDWFTEKLLKEGAEMSKAINFRTN